MLAVLLEMTVLIAAQHSHPCDPIYKMLAFDIAYLYCATVTYESIDREPPLFLPETCRVLQETRYSVRDAITRCEIYIRHLGGTHFRPFR